MVPPLITELLNPTNVVVIFTLVVLLSKYFHLLYRLVYPAYSSFKAIINGDVKESFRWLMYWIALALFTFVEDFIDLFIGFWLPFYSQIKILFFICLMSCFGEVLYLRSIHRQLAKYEQTIDSYIAAAKRSAMDLPWLLLNMAVKKGFIQSTRIIFFFYRILPPPALQTTSTVKIKEEPKEGRTPHRRQRATERSRIIEELKNETPSRTPRAAKTKARVKVREILFDDLTETGSSGAED